MRLIDADALLKALNDYGLSYRADINGMIMQAPTIAPSGDLISREDAIDAICKSWCYVTYMDCPHADDGFRCDGCDDIEAIEALPSAEPKTGKWIDCNWSIRCSECGYSMPWAVRNFCPNCGADMRGDKE